MNQLTERMIRAAKLEVAVYKEVEQEPEALKQAMMVVLISGLAAGLGNIVQGGLPGAVAMTIISLIGWFVWAFITYYLGTRLLPEAQTQADYGQLLRTIGFSSSPGVIRIACIIPGLSGIINLIGSIWMLIAMVVAVREALDYHSTFRAILVCLLGWLIQVLVIMLALMLFGGLPD